MRIVLSGLAIALAICGCTPRAVVRAHDGNAPPPMVVGDFIDDYGIAYRITPGENGGSCQTPAMTWCAGTPMRAT